MSLVGAPAVGALLASIGLDPTVAGPIELTGPEVALPSVFDVTSVAATAVAASTVAAARLGTAEGGALSPISVDRRHAALSFRAERYLRVDGDDPPALWDPLAGYYRDREGEWIQLHTNFEHHRAAALEVLGVDGDRTAVTAAIAEGSARDLEGAIARAGGCAARLRSAAAWALEPAGAAVAGQPLVDVRQVARAEPLGGGVVRPLRVLDLTRVIAGPVAGMVLADHGAEVLHVLGPELPTFDGLHAVTGFAKRETHLDLLQSSQRRRFESLVGDADVVLDAFRPGVLADLGFDEDALFRLRPGLVLVQLSAYGQEGPRARWRGFDSLVQTTSGICDEGRRAAGVDEPAPLPAQVLDHATGHLAAFSALAGRMRQADEGGSWRVRLSLARTARWLIDVPRVPGDAAVSDTDPADLLEETESELGRLTTIRPPGRIDGHPVAHQGPPRPRGADEPAWSSWY